MRPRCCNMRAGVLAAAGVLTGLGLLPGPGGAALAESVIATRTLRAQTVIAAGDVELIPDDLPLAADDLAAVIGQETRVVVYQGRAVRPGDLGPPALVDRNQNVTLIYRRGGLLIIAEGRALGRGGTGERVRAMNLESRTTVEGTVTADGQLDVN